MITQFRVLDATCGHCKQTIEGAVSGIDGVTGAALDLGSKTLTVEHDKGVETDALAGAVTGCRVLLGQDRHAR